MAARASTKGDAVVRRAGPGTAPTIQQSNGKAPESVRSCARCGGSLEGMKPVARYCSIDCKDAANHARRKAPVTEVPVADEDETIETRSRAVLIKTDRLATPLGAAVLRMARILDTSSTMNGYASLMKQWQDTLEGALAGAVVEPDEVDELRAFRDRKFAG